MKSTLMMFTPGFLMIFITVSCGLPDPLASGDTLNAPSDVTVWYDGSRLFFDITGENTFDSSPGFGGYNLYYSDSETENVFFNNYVYKGTYSKPTFEASPSSSVKTTRFFLDELVFTNRINKIIESNELAVYNDYYFTIASYDLSGKNEKHLDRVIHYRAPYRIQNLNSAYGQKVQIEKLAFKITKTSLWELRSLSNTSYPEASKAAFQAGGYNPEWEKGFTAPEEGYIDTVVPVYENYIYYFSIASPGEGATVIYDYAMIKILNLKDSTFEYHISYQVNSRQL